MPSQIRTLPKKQRIAEAVKMIKSGATIREAAKKYYVPASTVFYQLGDKAPAARQIFSRVRVRVRWLTITPRSLQGPSFF